MMVDEVICPYCGKTFTKLLHHAHLRSHGKTLADVKNEFPNHATMTNEESRVRSIRRLQATEKIKQTCIEKYGGVGFASEGLKEKVRETNIERYGVENYMLTEEAKEKFRNAEFQRTEKRRKKLSESLKGKKSKLKGKRYNDIFGEEKADLLKLQKSEKLIALSIPRILREIDYLGYELFDDKFLGAHYSHNWKCKKCGTIFVRIWNSLQQGFQCQGCYPRLNGSSLAEKEIVEFLKDILPNKEIIENSRRIIPPKELDIYIPSEQMAIEYDGFYWHSGEKKEKTYHLEKMNMCVAKNIKLIQIFEDEWAGNKDLVKQRLIHILGKFNGTRIYARNCSINLIDSNTKNDFLTRYHIQGYDIGSSVRLGAFHDNELVAIMTFSKGNIAKGSISEEGLWELNRFCSNYNFHIPGIAGKLLKYFQFNFPWKTIFSFCDRRWSTGDLYRKLGFVTDEKIRLGYWYVKGIKRYHRYSLRKRNDEPKDISESVLRAKEGYIKIWDSGSLKFVTHNKS